MEKIAITLLLSLLLPGCSSINAQVKTPPLPASLSRPCLDPATLPEGANMGDLLDVAVVNKLALIECKARHEATVKAWPHSD